MYLKTGDRVKQIAAFGLFMAETAHMVRLARESDGAVWRAAKSAMIGSSAGAMLGGGTGFALAELDEPEETLAATAVCSAIGWVAGGLVAGVTSLVRDAFRA